MNELKPVFGSRFKRDLKNIFWHWQVMNGLKYCIV